MTKSQNQANLWRVLSFLKGAVFLGGLIFVIKEYFSELIEGLLWVTAPLVIAFSAAVFGSFVFLFFLWILPKAVTSYVSSHGGEDAFREDRLFQQFLKPLLIKSP